MFSSEVISSSSLVFASSTIKLGLICLALNSLLACAALVGLIPPLPALGDPPTGPEPLLLDDTYEPLRGNLATPVPLPIAPVVV